MNSKVSAGILGGGITGLSVAYALHKKGIDVTVYEQSGLPGGVIQSHRKDGWLVEYGPNTLMVRSDIVWEFIHDLNLDDRITNANNESKKRFIVKDKVLCPVPVSIKQFLLTDLISMKAKFRLLKEPFISQISPSDKESVAEFISRRLGSEPLDYIINPFVSGIYAGKPERLSIKHTFPSLYESEQKYGSLIKGALMRTKKSKKTNKALISFDEGLHVLPSELHHILGKRVRLNSSVQDLRPSKNGWDILVDENSKQTEHHHDAIISSLPSYRLQKMKGLNAPKISAIHYAPVSVLALGFKHSQVGHPLDGFGMLIPRKEPYHMLGTLFSSSLFPERAPDDHVLLTSFIGGDRNPSQAKKSTDELIEQTVTELSELLDIQGSPIYTNHVFWEKAIPQFMTGYDRFLEVMEQVENQYKGLFIAGNFRNGVSVPDCISYGIETAERAALFLSSQQINKARNY